MQESWQHSSAANSHPLLPRLDALQPSQPRTILGSHKQWLCPCGWERAAGESSKERGSARWAQAAAREKLVQEGFHFCVYFNGNPMGHFRFAVPREMISSCFPPPGSIPHMLVETKTHQNFQSIPCRKELLQQSVNAHATAGSVIPLWLNSNMDIHQVFKIHVLIPNMAENLGKSIP